MKAHELEILIIKSIVRSLLGFELKLEQNGVFKLIDGSWIENESSTSKFTFDYCHFIRRWRARWRSRRWSTRRRLKEEEREVEPYANVTNFNQNLTDPALFEDDIEAAKRRIWTLLSFKLFSQKRRKTKINGQPDK